jgi:hypothetical protein
MTFVSEHAAELTVHDPLAMPDRFDLLFSPIAQSWRACSVIARRYGAKSIRISFLAQHLPFYSLQHSLEDQQIPQGPNRPADLQPPQDAGSLIELSAWKDAAAVDEMVA